MSKDLEAIDNANPSEALEYLEEWKYQINSYIDCSLDCGDIDTECYNHLMDELEQYYITIKQALLKQQEPKKYLKWEDLEFKEEVQTMEVLLNGETYVLDYKFYPYEHNVIHLSTLEYDRVLTCCGDYGFDKQFFNDLHLERVEE